MCKLFKTYFEKEYILNNDNRFILELKNFAQASDTYKASFGHDDLVMSQAQLVLAEESIQFKYMREEFEETAGIVNNKYYNIYEGVFPGTDSMYDFSQLDNIDSRFGPNTKRL